MRLNLQIRDALSLFAVVMTAFAIISISPANAGGACPGVAGNYTILNNQTYALCAGAKSVNFGQITYAKCKISTTLSPATFAKTSVSKTESYPFPPSGTFPNQSTMGGTPTGDITTVNQGGANAAYLVSTYSPPPASATKLYTCDGGSYAQCDGGLCFKNTTGTKNNPLWGNVANDEIVCSCPVTTSKIPYQVFGPATCPAVGNGVSLSQAQAQYDAICGANVSNANNGAVIYIGSVINGPDLLTQCLASNTSGAPSPYPALQKCSRP